MKAIARALTDDLGRLPLLREALSLAYGFYYSRASGYRRLFKGVYPDFAGATRAVPHGGTVGYDNKASAWRLVHERHMIFPHDYPVMFWLSRLLGETTSIFDWGGNVGISYLAYRTYLRYPDGLTWIVNDVPAVVAVGRKLAAAEDAPNLLFTTDFDALETADILLAAGSLQFIDDPYAPLRAASMRPRHVLLNKVPVYDKPSAATLQNMGTAFVPNHLFNRAEIIGNFKSLGYGLADAWSNPGLGCYIPFNPTHSIKAYSGFYFIRS